MAIRGLLEPQAMPLVVAWATAADFDEMERCLAGGDRAVSYEEFETWDLALHRCIMAASHSQLLGTLYAAIEAARHGQVWGDLKRRSASRERRLEYQQDHRALVAALRARDSAGAVAAMRRHLSRVADHLLGQGQWSGPADYGRARPPRDLCPGCDQAMPGCSPLMTMAALPRMSGGGPPWSRLRMYAERAAAQANSRSGQSRDRGCLVAVASAAA